jgi:hypothetical protein
MRRDGRVVSVAAIIAWASTAAGRRELLDAVDVWNGQFAHDACHQRQAPFPRGAHDGSSDR